MGTIISRGFKRFIKLHADEVSVCDAEINAYIKKLKRPASITVIKNLIKKKKLMVLYQKTLNKKESNSKKEKLLEYLKSQKIIRLERRLERARERP